MVFWNILPTAAQDVNFVKAEVDVLTSAKFSGRGYVNDGCNEAGFYLMTRFRQLGLLPAIGGYAQHFSLSANTFSDPTVLKVDGQPFEEGAAYIVDPASGSVSGTWEMFFLDSTHFQGRKKLPSAKGRVPVIDLKGINLPDEVSAMYEFKRSMTTSGPVVLLQPEKLTWSVGNQSYKYPVFEVLSDSFPKKPQTLEVKVNAVQSDHQVFNVIGFIPGLRSDSSIVITAHYDHLGMMGDAMFPGASDNGSGVAMLLDMARHFGNSMPTYNIWFIAFAGEEAGLVGSKYFVENPLIPLPSIKLLLNLDLMGSAASAITVVNGKLYPRFIEKLTSINEASELVPRIKLRGKAANSDHFWFSESGVPAIFIYTEGTVESYHDINDVASGLDWARYDELFTLLTQFVNEI